MAEQHKLSMGPLLNEKGDLNEAGYAFSLTKRYDRSAIKAKPSRIKEWDYYYVGNEDYGVALTVADNGYMAMASISILDFKLKKDFTKSVITWFPMGKLGLPRDSRLGDIKFEDEKKGFSMSFAHQGQKRRLICCMKKFNKAGAEFRCDLLLEETNGKSMVIATPFKKSKHFYYNQKITNLLASGYAKIGERTYDFNGSYGVLDWGRGVWTYRNTWYWSNAQAKVGDHIIGWNLGYGFGDTSAASENMLFVDDQAYKLQDVKFDIPMKRNGGDDFMKPWKFRSSNGDIQLVFTPVYDRHSDTNALIIRSNQHQVFGIFSGSFLVEGKTVSFDSIPGFAEKVYNRW